MPSFRRIIPGCCQKIQHQTCEQKFPIRGETSMQNAHKRQCLSLFCSVSRRKYNFEKECDRWKQIFQHISYHHDFCQAMALPKACADMKFFGVVLRFSCFLFTQPIMIVGSEKVMRIIVENNPLITNHCGSTKFGKFRSCYIDSESSMGLTAETLTIDFNETWRSVGVLWTGVFLFPYSSK